MRAATSWILSAQPVPDPCPPHIHRRSIQQLQELIANAGGDSRVTRAEIGEWWLLIAEHNYLIAAYEFVPTAIERALEYALREWSPAQRGRCYNLAGMAHFRMEACAEAARYFEWSVREAPQDAAVWHNLGLCRLHLAQYEEAQGAFARAVQLDPNDASTYHHWGVVLSRLGDSEGALRRFQQAITVDRDYAPSYLNRGLLLLENGEINPGYRDICRAAALEPKRAKYWNYRGLAHMEICEFRTALLDYNRAIELDPMYAPAYLNRALLFEATGNPEVARDSLIKFLRLEPKNDYAQRLLARIEAKLNRPDAPSSDPAAA